MTERNSLGADFKMTEIGPLPEHWLVLPLGEILLESNLRAKDLPSEGRKNPPVLSLTKNRGLILQSERFGKQIATDDVSKYKVVHRGQIVYNPYVIWEGAVHALRDFELGLVSPVYPVWSIHADRADPFFVDDLLRMPTSITAYNRFASGAVNRRRSIKKKDFLSIPIPLPPLSEQRAIARVLSAVRRAIEATEAVIEAAQALKKSLMQHLFTYGPVPVDEIDQVPLKETEIGLVPEGWEVVRLGDVAIDVQYGANNRAGSDGTYPILRMNNLIDGKVDLSSLKYVDLSEADFHRFHLRPGDILFNRTNSYELVGKAALFDKPGDFVFASYLIRVVTDQDRIRPEFLNYYLNWPVAQSRLRMLATRGVSQSNISASKLKGFLVHMPPIATQVLVAKPLASIDEKIGAETQRKSALEALFNSLLHHLMTGKVRVPREYWIEDT